MCSLTMNTRGQFWPPTTGGDKRSPPQSHSLLQTPHYWTNGCSQTVIGARQSTVIFIFSFYFCLENWWEAAKKTGNVIKLVFLGALLLLRVCERCVCEWVEQSSKQQSRLSVKTFIHHWARRPRDSQIFIKICRCLLCLLVFHFGNLSCKISWLFGFCF